MGEVMRFNMIPAGQPNPAKNGLYVRHDDYATLESENAKLRAELERRADDGWLSDTDPEATPEQNTIYRVSGLRAGQALNSICRMIGGRWPDAKLEQEAPIAHRFFMELIGAAPSTPKADDPVKVQMLEALEELMYARTDKAEELATAAIAAARQEVKP